MNIHEILKNVPHITNSGQLVMAVGTGSIVTTVACGSFAKDLHESNYGDAVITGVGCAAALFVDAMVGIRTYDYLADYHGY